MCSVLLVVRKVVRKRVYNYNHFFKAADHIHVGVRTCTVAAST